MGNDKAEAVARALLGELFGEEDAPLVRCEAGLSNQVFETSIAAGALILRLSASEGKVESFARERRVIARAHRARVPAPEICEVGKRGEWAYTIARRMPGEPAIDHPERLSTLRHLARLVAEHIHIIKTNGYGREFEFEPYDGSDGSSWQQWLDEDLGADARLQLLHSHQVISDRQLALLRETLEWVRTWSGQPVLNHGDLRLKNVLVDADGRLTGLLDWEAAVSAIGPDWDLSLALHDLSVDEKEAFLEAYGLSAGAAHRAAPVWRLFNAVNYAPELEKIVHSGNAEALARLRARFSGVFDLYGEHSS